MGLESIIEASSEILGAEFFKKDAEFLAGLEGLGVPGLTEGIMGHLEKEGRPGSAEYMDMFYRSCCLNEQLTSLKAGTFDPRSIEQAGLPLMIKVPQTTSEMISKG